MNSQHLFLNQAHKVSQFLFNDYQASASHKKTDAPTPDDKGADKGTDKGDSSVKDDGSEGDNESEANTTNTKTKRKPRTPKDN